MFLNYLLTKNKFMLFIMSIIRKEQSMIKATISNQKQRNTFAKKGVTKIATGKCVSKPSIRGLVLDKYKYIGSGTCVLQQEQNRDNVVLFTKQKEVA